MRQALPLLALVAVARVPAATAQVTVEIDPQRAAGVAAALGVPLAQLQSTLENSLSEVFYSVKPEQLLGGLANAAALSSKGLGADYASNPSVASIGIALNVSASGDETSLESDLPFAGIGANVGIMVGLNVGMLTKNPVLDRLTAYASGFYLSTSSGPFALTMRSLALHGQYKLIRGSGGRLLNWGGLDFTGGLEFSQYRVNLEKTLETEVPLEEDEDGLDLTTVQLAATGRLGLGTSTVTFSSEVTTSATLLHVLTLYGGLGADVVTGETTIDADLSGSMSSVGEAGNMQSFGNARIVAAASGYPNGLHMRMLLGLQANLWRARAFTQLNLARDYSLGLVFGVRYAW